MKIKDKSHILLTVTVIALLISSVLVFLSLISTNPTALGPGGVTFWFISFLFMASSALTLLLYKVQNKRPKYADNKSLCYFSSLRSGLILGVSVTVLLALSSLRSLSWRDFFLFAASVVLVEILLRTRRAV